MKELSFLILTRFLLVALFATAAESSVEDPRLQATLAQSLSEVEDDGAQLTKDSGYLLFDSVGAPDNQNDHDCDHNSAIISFDEFILLQARSCIKTQGLAYFPYPLKSTLDYSARLSQAPPFC